MKKYIIPVLFFTIGLVGSISVNYSLNLDAQLTQQFKNLPGEIRDVDTNSCSEFPDLCSKVGFFGDIGNLIIFPVILITFFIHPSISYLLAPIVYALLGMLIVKLYTRRKNYTTSG